MYLYIYIYIYICDDRATHEGQEVEAEAQVGADCADLLRGFLAFGRLARPRAWFGHARVRSRTQ